MYILRVGLLLAICLLIIGCEASNEQMDLKLKEVNILTNVEEFDVEIGNIKHLNKYDENIYVSNGDQIVKYNLHSKDNEIIYQSKYESAIIQHVMSNENWIIWLDSSEDGMKNKIYALNKKDNETHIVSEADPNYTTVDFPFLYNNYVAWVYLDTQNEVPKPVIKLHNLNDKDSIIVSEINDYALYNNFVHIDNGKLLWTDHKDQKGYYKIYDISTKEIKAYESPYKYPSYAMLSNNKIFALHFNNLSDWDDQEFGFFDLNKNEYHSFFKERKRVDLFRLKNNNLTLINAEGEMENFVIEGNNIKANSLNLNHDGPDNIEYTSNGELIFNYIQSENQKNYIVVVN